MAFMSRNLVQFPSKILDSGISGLPSGNVRNRYFMPSYWFIVNEFIEKQKEVKLGNLVNNSTYIHNGYDE